MINESKKCILRLRFSEFKNASCWNKYALHEISPCVFDGTHQTPNYIKNGIPFFSVENIVSNAKNKYISNEDYCLYTTKNKPEKGDIIITRIGNIGFSKVITWDYEFSIYVTLAIIKKGKSFNSFFIHYFIQSELCQREIKRKSLLDAIPCKINLEDLKSIHVFLPNLQEQQKIADCLSSLDELIEAHEQKLDALKQHKKGLMQRLFPAEGETTPRWRFPEFRNAGEWKTRSLGSMTQKIGSGVTPRGGDKNYISSGIPFVRSQNIGWGKLLLDDIVFISYEIHKTFLSTEIQYQDVLLNITGASIGRCAIANRQISGGNVNQHVCIIRTNKNELNPIFLMQYIISYQCQNQINNFQAGGNRQGLNFAQVASFNIPTTSLSEQQKIADCLTSIDEQIEAQEEKITALKEHKKGLMQQLFPSL